MSRIEIPKDRCKGCGLCIGVCPKNLLKMGNELNAIGNYYIVQNDAEQCIGCKFCGMICPDSAIEVYR